MINFFSQRPELLGLGLGNLLGCNRSGLLGNNGSFFGRNLSRLLERSLDSGYDVGYGGLLGIDSGLHGFLDAGFALLLHGSVGTGLSLLRLLLLFELALFGTFGDSAAHGIEHYGNRFGGIVICRDNVINVGRITTSVYHCRYYLADPVATAMTLSQADIFLLVGLPVFSAALYPVLLALFGRRTIVPLTAPVAGFVVFFLYKALSFSSVLHTVLCSILYLAVLVFFLLTALGVLRTRIFLILLAGLPLLVHIIMDLSDYEGFFLFLPELSVLLLMASLLCLALRLRPAGKGAKP